ncbi:hypothetical protein HanPSC8_Chr09g0369181 [Helianthus annuus]|nr:hypothetical protein HanPSC8_Chr09g0369181 [Helianthus annuus]
MKNLVSNVLISWLNKLTSLCDACQCWILILTFGYYYYLVLLYDLVFTLTESVGCVRCGGAHGLNSGSSFRVSLLSLRLYIAN